MAANSEHTTSLTSRALNRAWQNTSEITSLTTKPKGLGYVDSPLMSKDKFWGYPGPLTVESEGL